MTAVQRGRLRDAGASLLVGLLVIVLAHAARGQTDLVVMYNEGGGTDGSDLEVTYYGSLSDGVAASLKYRGNQVPDVTGFQAGTNVGISVSGRTVTIDAAAALSPTEILIGSGEPLTATVGAGTVTLGTTGGTFKVPTTLTLDPGHTNSVNTLKIIGSTYHAPGYPFPPYYSVEPSKAFEVYKYGDAVTLQASLSSDGKLFCKNEAGTAALKIRDDELYWPSLTSAGGQDILFASQSGVTSSWDVAFNNRFWYVYRNPSVHSAGYMYFDGAIIADDDLHAVDGVYARNNVVAGPGSQQLFSPPGVHIESYGYDTGAGWAPTVGKQVIHIYGNENGGHVNLRHGRTDLYGANGVAWNVNADIQTSGVIRTDSATGTSRFAGNATIGGTLGVSGVLSADSNVNVGGDINSLAGFVNAAFEVSAGTNVTAAGDVSAGVLVNAGLGFTAAGNNGVSAVITVQSPSSGTGYMNLTFVGGILTDASESTP